MNPFQSASGTTVAVGNPFMQPASAGERKFPSMDDLYSRLVLMTPQKLEVVPKKEEHGGGEQERYTTDVVVLDGGHVEYGGEFDFGDLPCELDGMYIFNTPIIGALKGAHRKHTAVLGRVWRVPVKANRDKYPTREAIQAALDNWRIGMPKISFGWALGDFTQEDADLAMKYLDSKKADPFS